MPEIEKIIVKKVMTKNVVTISRKTTVGDLRRLFEEYDYNGFPVIEEDNVVGIVTKIDFLRICRLGLHPHAHDFWKLLAEKAEDIMGRNVITVTPEDTLEDVADIIIEYKLRSIPVVEDSKLVGIISRGDVLRHTHFSAD